MNEPGADGGGPFSRRGAAWLAALAAGSLAAAGFLGAFGDVLYDPPSFGPDSFSRSAVGHRAFAELVRGLGFRVVVSRHRTAERAGAGAVVALLEPRLGEEDPVGAERLGEIDGAARALLVVLPKREARPDPVRPRFVAAADPVAPAEVQRVLDALAIGGKVVRPDRTPGTWHGELPAPSLDAPQLIVSEHLRPLLASDEGILVGELAAWDEEDEEHDAGAAGPVSLPAAGTPRWQTIVVADPDLLASHGLGRGENAVLLVRILERLGAGDLPIVIDETTHGLEQRPSLALELVRFPLVLATGSALLVAALLAWGALVRFGRPIPPAPELKPGRVALVESTAALLRHGGHCAHAAAAYLRAAKERVTLHHGRGGEGGEGAWLAGLVEARGRGAELRAIEERVQRLAARRGGGEEEAVRTAQAIHRWREEMTDGAHGDPGRDRAAQG